MNKPNSLTFDGSKGTDPEVCPVCGKVVWLGVGENGEKMCQACYLKPDKQDD